MKELRPKAEQGIIFDRNGLPNAYCGWPSIAKDDRGVLYAAGSCYRITHVCPFGKNVMFTSHDDGKTWSNPIIVHDSPFDDRDCGIVSLGGGKMVFASFADFYEDYCSEILSMDFIGDADKALIRGIAEVWKCYDKEAIDKYTGSYVLVSDDYGATWSDIIKVPLTAPHGPCVLKDGTLVYMGKEQNPKYLADNPIVVYTSRDDGRTWEYTGTVPPGDDIANWHMHEPHVVELPDGRLMGAIRVHGRENATPMNTIYTTFSSDKGKTWTTPKCIGVDGLPPHLLVHSSGAILCSYACRTEGKWAEMVAVSYDGGETFTENYTLRDAKINDIGYASSVELSDGSIMTAYYHRNNNVGQPGILYTKWRLGDVIDIKPALKRD